MKRISIIGLLVGIAALAKGMISKGYDAPSASPETKRHGKSKGGGKRRGFIKGFGKPHKMGTRLGNSLPYGFKVDTEEKRVKVWALQEPNWHRTFTNKPVRTALKLAR